MSTKLPFGLIAFGALALGTATLFLLPQVQESGTRGPVGIPAQPAPEAPVRESVTLLSGRFTLALSWQPAFCEQKPYVPECASQTAARADARQFSIHGLWPEPQGNEYCDVSTRDVRIDKSGNWDQLPAPDISAATWSALRELMPGTQSGLERHEWIKHGTCADGDAEAYFAATIALTDSLNGSGVADLFESSIGQRLDADEIRDAFDQAFGRGAGTRVTIECANDGDRRIIDELRISIEGTIGEDSFEKLLANAAPRQRGCPQGFVDAVGNQ